MSLLTAAAGLTPLGWARLLWKPVLILALILIVRSHWIGVGEAKWESKYAALETAYAADRGIWTDALERLTQDLADAKSAGDKALADKAEAEKDAAKKLAATNKQWKRLYDSKPENRAWADAPLPADVRGRLQNHTGD